MFLEKSKKIKQLREENEKGILAKSLIFAKKVKK